MVETFDEGKKLCSSVGRCEQKENEKYFYCSTYESIALVGKRNEKLFFFLDRREREFFVRILFDESSNK
jgi:hypothetical protein